MYLKSVEVQGFKSFANKIVFEFHNGITGIVGPNGSGKSNVVDAVRWVFGEQSAKQLRGGNMQDVIFAGTELRKPQGYAYVAITMDNSDHLLPIDFDEVTVSRRLYRSGESEYMINGSPCRLKDINEMFFDTGIGKEGYSIIGQSQVDKILSVKPDDRRELFDEAAGITKFKRRKIAALKKLENEKANLLRITDILSELEKQVGPLKKQSEDAKQYLAYKDSLKKYDVNLFLIESKSLKEQLDEINKNEEIVDGDIKQATRDSDKLKAKYEDLENLIASLDKTITETRDNIASLNIESGDLTGHINVLNEQINTERMNEEHINSRIAAIKADIEARQSGLDEYTAQKTQMDSVVAEATQKQDAAEKELRQEDEKIMLLDKTIEDEKAMLISILNEKADLSAKDQRYEAMLEQIQVRKSEVAQKLLKIKSDEATFDEQLNIENNKLTNIVKSIEEIDSEINSLDEELTKINDEASRLNKLLLDTQSDYQARFAKLESLKNIAERYDGYGNSIKKVMESRDRINGIHGVIADLISVDKEYETAIETALGGRIQNVVTDSEETAKQLIEYLKKNKFGRVTFLPITSVGDKDKISTEAVKNEDGFIAIASELVKTDESYRGVVNSLLGKTLVVDTIDHAIAIERKNRYEYHIVTKEGEYLNPRGSISGGAFKNSSNLLGRKREIEELEEQLFKIQEKSDSYQADLDKNNKLKAEKSDAIESGRAKKQEALIEQNTIQVNIDKLNERRQEIERSSGDFDLEHAQLEEQINEINTNKANISTDVLALDQKNTDTQAAITENTAKIEEARANRERYSNNLSQVQLDTAAAKQKLAYIEENLNRINSEVSRFNEELSELSSGIAQSKEGIADKNARIAEDETKIQDIAEKIKGLELIVSESVEKKASKADEQKQFFDKRDEIATRLSELDKEQFRLASKKEKCTEKLDSHVTYMWSEYELTLETAGELRDEGLNDASDMRKNISDLKANIKALGNINVNAIDDYKEVSERYEFLKAQHDDIVEAEGSLTKIIEELDVSMRKQFEEQFAAIGKEFDKVFKALFGGGTGKLELDEDTDILEAGIHIISQPPGKKLQNMMQLSGGEKALTAISLLFAIQNLKPSPFALLDEIEAALDDSNVDRFANYLHKLTKNTQFIVITHRRGTMVAADRLYGITMQEKGVSTLVSVNLIEDQLDN